MPPTIKKGANTPLIKTIPFKSNKKTKKQANRIKMIPISFLNPKASFATAPEAATMVKNNTQRNMPDTHSITSPAFFPIIRFIKP